MSVQQRVLSAFGIDGGDEANENLDVSQSQNLPEGDLINLGQIAQGHGHDGLARNSEFAGAQAHVAVVPGGAADGRDTNENVLTQSSQSGRSANDFAEPVDRSQLSNGVSAGTQARERRRRSVAASNGQPHGLTEQYEDQHDAFLSDGGNDYSGISFAPEQGIDSGGQAEDQRMRSSSATPAFTGSRHDNVAYERRGRRQILLPQKMLDGMHFLLPVLVLKVVMSLRRLIKMMASMLTCMMDTFPLCLSVPSRYRR